MSAAEDGRTNVDGIAVCACTPFNVRPSRPAQIANTRPPGPLLLGRLPIKRLSARLRVSPVRPMLTFTPLCFWFACCVLKPSRVCVTRGAASFDKRPWKTISFENSKRERKILHNPPLSAPPTHTRSLAWPSAVRRSSWYLGIGMTVHITIPASILLLSSRRIRSAPFGLRDRLMSAENGSLQQPMANWVNAGAQRNAHNYGCSWNSSSSRAGFTVCCSPSSPLLRTHQSPPRKVLARFAPGLWYSSR